MSLPHWVPPGPSAGSQGSPVPATLTAPAGLEGSGGGSPLLPGGLLNHDPVGTQPRLTSFPKYKCRESSGPTQAGMACAVGRGFSEMSWAPDLIPLWIHTPKGTPTELIKCFATRGSQF